MHYVVEVRTAAGGWRRKRGEHRLLTAAQLETERARAAGGVARVIQVVDDGTRRVVG